MILVTLYQNYVTLMYDKVKFFIPRTRTMPDISKYLNSAKEQVDLKTGEVCTFGRLDCLKINTYVGGCSIIGSLSHFFNPSNIYPLDRKTTAQAIELLSDKIHIDVSDAKVTTLEFGTQFVMRKQVSEYLKKLGDMPNLLRYHFDVGTLYYKSKGKQQQRVFCFYDKIADAKAKELIIPDGLQNENLLKYEMRLNRPLSRQLGLSQVEASTLYDREFYKMLVEKWQAHYFSIKKSKCIKTNIMSEIKTVSDAYDVYVARFICQDKGNSISDFIDELKENKVFSDRKSYTRLKDKILKVANKATVSMSDEDIKELDDEIQNVGAYV